MASFPDDIPMEQPASEEPENHSELHAEKSEEIQPNADFHMSVSHEESQPGEPEDHIMEGDQE